MAMSYVWVILLFVSVVFGALTGSAGAVGAAAVQGAESAVELTLSLAGPMIFYSALLEVMERSGLTEKLSRALRPVLGRLFPSSRSDPELAGELSCNMSANLLGLGNAATPAGIRAAQRLHALSGGEAASDELCRLAVLNTASIQLLPTTAAALRSACGAENAFDILPAVWISSAACGAARRAAFPEIAMKMLLQLLPALLAAGVGGYAIFRGTDVFSALTDGALQGLRTVGRIAPVLVCLLPAVGALRASGAIDAFTALLRPALSFLGIPAETVPLMLLRPMSGSGALAVAGDIFTACGADSPAGRTAAVMLGSTETTFYVLSVYFGAAGVRKTRHAVPAALCADLAGFLAAAFCVNVLHL